jgi:hypothetical protein
MSDPITLGEYNGIEIYPMPLFATVACDDLVATAAWYERALGFGVMFRAPMLVHVRRHKYQDLLLVPRVGGPPGGASALTLNFSADGEVDALAERARAAAPSGQSAVQDPIDTPWNTHDLHVTDPVGNHLVFTSRCAHPDPEAQARWQTLFAAGRGGRET